MKVGLISYNFPHLKSDQVFQGLLRKNYSLTIYLLPFNPRKPRTTLINHRPNQTVSVDLETIGRKHGINVIECENDQEIHVGEEYYLVLGAGILSPECVKNKKIVNCHPGIIPSVRGLDSFKYSILNSVRLGVSLHYIDEKVDAGELISTRETNVYFNDSLETLSRRHYENEIDFILNFENFLKSPEFVNGEFPENPPTMRMGIEEEAAMVRAFDTYVSLYGG